jgi:hypothetical protein
MVKNQYIDEYGIDSLKHLKIAVAEGVDIFFTNNEEMLADSRKLERLYNIKIRRP